MEFIQLPSALLSVVLEEALEVPFGMPVFDEVPRQPPALRRAQRQVPFRMPTFDEVPCAGADGSVGLMPVREDIEGWFNSRDDDFGEQRPWYSFSLSDANLPSGWSEELSQGQQAFLSRALNLLSDGLTQSMVFFLRNGQLGFSYPRSWGERERVGEPRFRVTVERLLDRLWINQESGSPRELRNYWYDSNNTIQDLRETFFGIVRNTDSHPYLRLRRSLAQGSLGNALNDFVGTASVPEDFVLPLDWSEAVFSGLSSALEFKVPDDQREVLRGWAAATNPDGRAERQDFDPTQSALFWVFLIARFLGFERNDFSDELQSAVEQEHANELLAGLMGAIAVADWDSLYANLVRVAGLAGLASGLAERWLESLGGGLTKEEWRVLQRMFSDAESVAGMSRPAPTILLGATFQSYAERFGGFSEGIDLGDPMGVVGSQRAAYRAWHTWWNRVQPSRDVAYVFDVSGRVLKQLLYADDAILALSEIVGMEGVLGHVVRSAVFKRRLFHLYDALGGASPADIIAYYWRQMLTDSYFASFPATDPECLYPVFCWMSSRAKRAAIDAALGAPVVIPTPPVATAVRFGGALGNVVQVIQAAVDAADGDVDLVQVLRDEISQADALALRTWVLYAKSSCLENVNALHLEPHWTYLTRPAGEDFDPEVEEARAYDREEVL